MKGTELIMDEKREFTAEELYARLLRQKRAAIVSFLDTLIEETRIWQIELEQVDRDIKEAPQNG